MWCLVYPFFRPLCKTKLYTVDGTNAVSFLMLTHKSDLSVVCHPPVSTTTQVIIIGIIIGIII